MSSTRTPFPVTRPAPRASDAARTARPVSAEHAGVSDGEHHHGGTHHDAVVVGGGIAGLTTAATLARAGLDVVLLEKQPVAGGYSDGHDTHGFHWDHGGHIFLAYRLGGQAREVFKRLGLDEKVVMEPHTHDYRCVLPEDSVAVPADLSAAAEEFTRRFPHEREGIEAVFLAMEQMVADLDVFVPSFRVQAHPGERRLLDPVFEQFQRPWVSRALAPAMNALHLPGATLAKYQGRTLQDLLDEHLVDPTLKAYFSMLCVGIASAPSELSAVIAGVFFTHALRTQWMPRGGFSVLRDALLSTIAEAGGAVVRDAEVTRVLTTDGRATGVRTADGRTFTADAVVSAGDARRTFTELLPPLRSTAALRRRLPTMATTPSFFQVQLGVDMDLEPYRDAVKRLTFVYPEVDIDASMARFPAGDVEHAAFYVYVATFHQPEMAPPGMHSIKLECPTRLASAGIDWERDAERIADVFVRRAEALIPGLPEHVVVRQVRTPADLARDTGNAEGAFAGWAFSPELLSRERPAQRTPVPGLYLAGHWSQPTAGVPWVMLSGYNTAGMVIADRARSRRGAGRTTA
ncbi:phytoene desaturase family protein [Miniimonas arenae]|uniref:phytoene desaturase family protein n=1 Tax=Miniimonas arenae TaxID=676201 RepID=UPI0028AAD4C2|nr:FAD-dependent oxidoreductase [Miniimonas arenae]